MVTYSAVTRVSRSASTSASRPGWVSNANPGHPHPEFTAATPVTPLGITRLVVASLAHTPSPPSRACLAAAVARSGEFVAQILEQCPVVGRVGQALPDEVMVGGGSQCVNVYEDGGAVVVGRVAARPTREMHRPQRSAERVRI
jgi:hypothetical protein